MTELVEDLKGLSSAEEFFGYFGLGYDPRILAAARLHILKRFHDNLGNVPALDDMEQAAQRAVYREQLERAYLAYTGGPALAQRAFPALERLRSAFIPLASVSLKIDRGPAARPDAGRG